jgi:hypothetical protein
VETLKTKREGHEEEPHAGDFYVVACEYSTWYVSAETAARIGEVLDRLWRPRWIKFVDVSGSRVWLQTGVVEAVYESTEAQRTRDRDFHHRRRREEKADRRWDEEE